MVRGPIEIIIIIIIIQALWGAFWGVYHAQKVSKLCRKLESGENCRIPEYLEMGVAKWLNSATWNAAPRFPFDRSSQKSQHRCILFHVNFSKIQIKKN